jgi:hypothetical protein
MQLGLHTKINLEFINASFASAAFLQPSGRPPHLTNYGLFTTFWPIVSFDQLWPFYNLLAEQII